VHLETKQCHWPIFKYASASWFQFKHLKHAFYSGNRLWNWGLEFQKWFQTFPKIAIKGQRSQYELKKLITFFLCTSQLRMSTFVSFYFSKDATDVPKTPSAEQSNFCKVSRVCRCTWRSSTLNFCDCGRLHYWRSWKWVCGFGSVYCHQCFCDCLYLGKGGVYGKCLLLGSHTAGSTGHRNPGDVQVKMRCASICFRERMHLRVRIRVMSHWENMYARQKQYSTISTLFSPWSPLKGLVHPKMKIKSLITHPHAVPTP